MLLENKKDFHVHISSIRAVDETTFPSGGNCFAVINCAGRKSNYLSVCPPTQLLTVPFIDTENKNASGCFLKENGTTIKSFLTSLPENVSDLFIFCDAGESRSPAVAAAILLASGRSDAPIWDNPFYHPNTLVFGRLCEALGIVLTEDQIAGKKQQSENAFKTAMKSGTNHTRWEII